MVFVMSLLPLHTQLKIQKIWADVDNIPENGTWFQSVQNGTLVINDGPSGLQKLDKVMELAQKHGLYILLSLTNNWNPQPPPGSSNPLPRGTLSNDYGTYTYHGLNTSLT